MPESRTAEARQPIQFKITIDGVPLNETVQIVSITITSAVNRIPSARIVVLDGDMSTLTFPVSDGDSFKLGARITIEVGYAGHTEPIFQGVVIRHGLKIAVDRPSHLVVECRDKALAMMTCRKSNNFIEMKDSDVIGKLLGNYAGLTSDVSATETRHKRLVQHDCTDWDFVLSRADANGLLVLTDQNKITVQAPQTNGPAQLKVAYGTDLIAFDAEIDSSMQLMSTVGAAEAWGTQALTEQSAEPTTLSDQNDLMSSTLADVVSPISFRLRMPSPTEQTAEKSRAATRQQVKGGLARIRGHMKFPGSAKAKIGRLITLEGVGKRFSGEVFVSAVNHELADGIWTTEVEFGISRQSFAERQDSETLPASRLIPAIEGLYLGIVKRLDGDPEGANRIQVSIPQSEGEADCVWSRLACYYASEGFGEFFLPEIGDEVVLGDLNSHPSDPIILGSLYSRKRQPPYTPAAQNNTKAIVTRNNLRLIFDDERKVVTMVTPGNNKVVISDDTKSIAMTDQNGNEAQLSPDGILLHSPLDIVIHAKGKIALSAGAEVSVVAEADVKMTGLNITNSAEVAFTAKGSASAELSAAGQTTVKGALVMIN